MPTPGSVQFFVSWAKERADEMDATLASLESKANDVQAVARAEAAQLIDSLRAKRGAFLATIEKQTEAGEAAWARAKADLEAQWAAYESQLSKYFDSFGKQAEEQQAAFQRVADVQMKAWREAADKIQDAARQVAAEPRSAIDATVARMMTDAAAVQEKLQKAAGAGNNSWSALNGVLAETRAVFDRANHAAWNAFK
jgi:uncharacterized phage infection (PIP) family protein YhgE